MESVLQSNLPKADWRERLGAYFRFVKIEHTLFSLPLLFAGAVLAAGRWPGLRETAFILLAGFGARTLALALNRIIDKNIDAKNPRTSGRELARGALSLADAVLISVASLLLYLWASLSLSPFCLLWSWVPVLLFLIYPTLKRFTWFSHFGLGVTWAMAPLAGWFALRPGFDGFGPAALLGVFSFFWLSGFDIIYATMDEDFDRREGLFSLPARFGRRRALLASSLLHWAAFFSLMVLFAIFLEGPTSSFLMIITGFLLFLEHLLIDDIDLAFFKINVVIGFVILGMVCFGVKAPI